MDHPQLGKPIQIISFDNRKLKLRKQELDKILNNKDELEGMPIAVLSVVGAYRTGKSFLLSWMERFLSSDVKVSLLSISFVILIGLTFIIFIFNIGVWLANKVQQ